MKGQNPTSAQVCLHKDGKFYIHVQIKSEPPNVPDTQEVIGVDFGRRDIAVTSTGQSWSGEALNKTRDRFSVGSALIGKDGKKPLPRFYPRTG